MTMTNYLFDAKTKSFFPFILEDVYRESNMWPEKGVEVDEDIFESFRNQPEGKTLGADKKGNPVWVDVPPPSKEQLTAMSEVLRADLKRVADSEIAWRQDAVDAEMATEDEVAALTAWKKYRVLLMRVDVNDPKWPKVPS